MTAFASIARSAVIILSFLAATAAAQAQADRQTRTPAAGATQPVDQPGDFDFYVLSLSWQPGWCAEKGATTGACRIGAGVGFILHGLWPQRERGWPRDCATEERDPSFAQTRAMADIMGSSGLAWHEWKKHGRCSGLGAKAYFELSRDAWQRISLPEVFHKINKTLRISPEVIETAFLKANPDLKADGVSITCKRGRISEVRICLDRNLEFRLCSDEMQRECRMSATLEAHR
jgi:ribonuclease T2